MTIQLTSSIQRLNRTCLMRNHYLVLLIIFLSSKRTAVSAIFWHEMPRNDWLFILCFFIILPDPALLMTRYFPEYQGFYSGLNYFNSFKPYIYVYFDKQNSKFCRTRQFYNRANQRLGLFNKRTCHFVTDQNKRISYYI